MMIGSKIKIAGKEYPCYQTMGAMRRFHRLTGREISEVQLTEVSAMADYLYCCVQAACSAEKVKFDYTVDDFADHITVDMMNEWAKSLGGNDEAEADAEKKS
jgi:hypothetical protein